jgi:hypothetical protein
MNGQHETGVVGYRLRKWNENDRQELGKQREHVEAEVEALVTQLSASNNPDTLRQCSLSYGSNRLEVISKYCW